MTWIAILKKVVSQYWREVVLIGLVTSIGVFVQNYRQLKEEAADAALRAARLQGQVEQHALDVVVWEKERQRLTDSLVVLQKVSADYRGKWQDAKKKAAGTVVYVPVETPASTNATPQTPPDTGGLKPIAILDHPVVKELIATAEAKQAADAEIIRVMQVKIDGDELLIAKQRKIIDSLGDPGHTPGPNKLKRLLTHVGAGIVGAFIGQKAKGNVGLVGGALAGTIAVSFY